MHKVGELVNRKEEAQQLIDKIQKKMTVRTNQNSIDALYLIWQKPYMAAGADTFIHDMMSYAGMRNVVYKCAINFDDGRNNSLATSLCIVV